MSPKSSLGTLAVALALTVMVKAATASVASSPPVDRPEVRISVENLRTTVHNCYWEFDWVIDNYGGVGATMTMRANRIIGRSDIRELPPWQKNVETDLRVEPWAQVRIHDWARLDNEEAGCAFRADGAFTFRDDRGLNFTVNHPVSDRWATAD